MLAVWFVLLIEVIAVYFVNLFAPGSAVPVALLIGIHGLVTMIFFLSRKRYAAVPLTLGFFLRLLVMLYDCATGYALPDSMADALGYYNSAVLWAEGRAANYGGMYSRLLGYLFRLTGASRPLAQYINVLISMTAVWVLYKTFAPLKLNRKMRKRLLWLACALPYSLYAAQITNRESVIVALAAFATHCAVRWYLQRRALWMLLCAAGLLSAAAFHAGIILLGAGYAVLFVTYSHGSRRFHFHRGTLPVLALLIGGLAFIGVAYSDVFLAKFSGKMNSMAILRQFNRETGGSAYLTWINANSLWQVLLFSPLKLMHFLYSPLPTNWRGLADAGSFAADGLIYLCITIHCFRRRRTTAHPRLFLSLALGLLCAALVFSLGTWTAGTAMRHRQKLFLSLLMLAAVSGAPDDQRHEY